MSSDVDSRPTIHASLRDLNVSYADSIIGAAIFDLSGLPKEYFITPQSNDMGWVQSVFQAIGLQSLIASSLQLEGFRHATIRGNEYRALVVRQKSRYVALLVSLDHPAPLAEDFIHWSLEFEPATLRSHPRFSAV